MQTRLVEEIQSKWSGKELLSVEETPSTNNVAKELIRQGAVHGTLVTAKHQTAGRGRSGRSWSSPKGTALAMSMILRPSFAVEKASMITLLQAVTVVRVLERFYKVLPQIKWPNDILVDKRKLCGILTELYLGQEKEYAVVVGTGMNVNQQTFPEEIKDIATSLHIQTGQVCSIEELMVRICEEFERVYESFEQHGDLSFLKEEYHKYMISRHKEVRVLDPNGEFSGIALGINDVGELLVQKNEQETVRVYAGEVSVRGIYGYV